MKIYINTDVENYAYARFFTKYIGKMGLRDGENNGIVFNIDSISNKGFIKGSRCTVYIEGDEFTNKGQNVERYAQSDLFYITQKNYLKYYPSKTKLIRLGVDTEWHYPRDVKKEYDYVFVGRTGGNPVYDHRKEVLEELQKSKYKILVTGGTNETYCDLSCSGRIILSINPRIGDDVCANLRTLEAMAMGCVMTDYDKSLDDWGIIPNVHYLPLDRFGDISDEEIARIHKTGREYVIKNFSWEEATKTIVNDIKEVLHED